MFSFFGSLARKGVVSLFCLFAFCFAQQDSTVLRDTLTQSGSPEVGQKDTFWLPQASRKEIIVRDSRESRIFEAPQSLAIVSSDQWKGTGKNIADALKNETGIETRKYGGTGSFQTISIRGIPGSKVLVFLDDIPLNSIDGSAVDLGKIPTSLIHEIDVYKGITPASLGGNSIGGAVVLKTPALVDSVAGDVMAGVGSYGHVQSSLALSYPIKDLKNADGYTNISYELAKNDFRYLDRNGTPYNLDDDLYRKQYNAQYRVMMAMQRLHLKSLLDNTDLGFSAKLQVSDNGLPGAEEQPTPTAEYGLKGIDVSMSGRYNGFVNQGLILKTLFSYAHNEAILRWTAQDHISPNYPTAELGNLEQRAILKVAGIWSSADSRFDIEGSVLGKYDEIVPVSHTESIHVNPRANNNEVSGSFSLDGTYHCNRIFDIVLGGQLEGVRQYSNSATDYFSYTLVGDTLNGNGYNHFQSVRVGVSSAGIQGLNLFANCGLYYRRPTLYERFGVSQQIRPNPNLVAEKGLTFDGGAKFSQKNFQGEVVVFSTQNDKAISFFARPSEQMMVALNLDNSSIYGVEASFQASFFQDKLVSRITSTYQNPVCRLMYSNNFKKQIPGEPLVSGSFGVTLQPLQFVSAEYLFTFKSPVYLDYSNLDQQPTLFLHDAKISAKMGPRFSAIVSINNLTNLFYYGDAYQANPFPGREIFVMGMYAF